MNHICRDATDRVSTLICAKLDGGNSDASRNLLAILLMAIAFVGIAMALSNKSRHSCAAIAYYIDPMPIPKCYVC